MPEHDIDPGFERLLEQRLREYAEQGVRPSDAVEIAHTAASGSTRSGASGWFGRFRLLPAPALGVLLSAALLVGLTATAFAAGWLRLPAPVDPSPSPSLVASPSPSPSPSPLATEPAPTEAPSPISPESPTPATESPSPPPEQSPTPGPTESPSPTPAPAPLTATSISLGDGQFCIVRSNGTIGCWGSNEMGQLGIGSLQPSFSGEVLQVVGIVDASQVSAGIRFNCALAGGTVSCWGEGGSGQLGNGATVNSAVPVTVSGLNGVTSVAAGGTHACALRGNGRISCWGSGQRLGDGSTADSSTPVEVTGIDDAVAIAAGWNHTCALRSGGTIACWGLNGDGATGYGQLGDGTLENRFEPVEVLGIDNVVRLAAGGWSTCAIRSDDTVWCWGYGERGGLGNGSLVNSAQPVQVSGISSAQRIAVGGWHACATVAGGSVWCWGANSHGSSGGQLGDGTTTDSATPVRVLHVDDATRVAASWIDSCAIESDGNLLCWGAQLRPIPRSRSIGGGED